MTSVKIVKVEYYMSYPVRDLDVCYSEFRGAEVRQVPVLQIFGSTREGTKTCLHVHGVLPYVYIPYDGVEPATSMAYKLAAEIDKALNISLGQSSANACFVHNVVLVSGIPIYGYHEKEHQYFKIFFYNPLIIKRACSLLENGAILGKHFQPHESHINYVLQFMIDYNLQGMNYINLAHVKYRLDPDTPELLANIPQGQILPCSVQKRTFCKLEVDALASDISNITEILSGRLAVNPGLAAIWEDERQRRRNHDLDSQLSFCLTQDRASKPKATATHRLFKQKLLEKLASAGSADDTSGDANRSVYPAESPTDADLLNASVVLANALTTPSGDSPVTAPKAFENVSLDGVDEHMLALLEGLKESTDASDESLFETSTLGSGAADLRALEMLQELKAAADIEEDSILSQTVQHVASDQSSDDEEEHSLSVPLPEDQVEANDALVWEDSFWDGTCEIPQLDGICDTDETDSTLAYNWPDIGTASQFANNPYTSTSRTGDQTPEILARYTSFSSRNANEVYLAQNEHGTLGLSQLLTRGLNILKACAPRRSDHKAHILSNVANPNLRISISVSAYDLTRFKVNVLRSTDAAVRGANNFENRQTFERPPSARQDQFELLLSNGICYIATELGDSGYCAVTSGCDSATGGSAGVATVDSVFKSAPKRRFPPSAKSKLYTAQGHRSSGGQEKRACSKKPASNHSVGCYGSGSSVSLVGDRGVSNSTQQAAICKNTTNKVGAVPSSFVLEFHRWLGLMEPDVNNAEQETGPEWEPLIVDGHVLDMSWAVDEPSEHSFTLVEHTEAQETDNLSAMASDACNSAVMIAGEPSDASCGDDDEPSVLDDVPCCEILGCAGENSVVSYYTSVDPRVLVLDSRSCHSIEVNAGQMSGDTWCALDNEPGAFSLSGNEHEAWHAMENSGDMSTMGCVRFTEVEVGAVGSSDTGDVPVTESDPLRATDVSPDNVSAGAPNTVENGAVCAGVIVPGTEVHLTVDVDSAASPESGCDFGVEGGSNDPIVISSDQNSVGVDTVENKVNEPVADRAMDTVIEISSDSDDSTATGGPRACNNNDNVVPALGNCGPECALIAPGSRSVTVSLARDSSAGPCDNVAASLDIIITSKLATLLQRPLNVADSAPINKPADLAPAGSKGPNAQAASSDGELRTVADQPGELSDEKLAATKRKLAELIERIVEQYYRHRAARNESVLPQRAARNESVLPQRAARNESVLPQRAARNESVLPQTVKANRPESAARRAARRPGKLPNRVHNAKERQLLNVPKLLRPYIKGPAGPGKIKRVRASLASILPGRSRRVRAKRCRSRAVTSTVRRPGTSSDDSSKSSDAALERAKPPNSPVINDVPLPTSSANNGPTFENASAPIIANSLERTCPVSNGIIDEPLPTSSANNGPTFENASAPTIANGLERTCPVSNGIIDEPLPASRANNGSTFENASAPTIANGLERTCPVSNGPPVTLHGQGEPTVTVTQRPGVRDECHGSPAANQAAVIHNGAGDATAGADVRVHQSVWRTVRFKSKCARPQADFRGCFRSGLACRDLCNTAACRPAAHKMPLYSKWYGASGKPSVSAGRRLVQFPIRPQGKSYTVLLNRYSSADAGQAGQSIVVSSSEEEAISTAAGYETQEEDTSEISDMADDSDSSENAEAALTNDVQSGAVKHPRTPLSGEPMETETADDTETEQNTPRTEQHCDTADAAVPLVPQPESNRAQNGGTVRKYHERHQASATVTKGVPAKSVPGSKGNPAMASGTDSSGKAASALTQVTPAPPGPTAPFTNKRKLRSSGGKGKQKADKLASSRTLDSSSSAETLPSVPPKKPKQPTPATDSTTKKRASKPAFKKKSGMRARKPVTKQNYWNVDGQGDTSDSSQSSSTGNKAQQRESRPKKPASSTKPGPSTGTVPRRKTRGSRGAAKRRTSVSASPSRQAPELPQMKQLQVRLVPLNLQHLDGNGAPAKEVGQAAKRPLDNGKSSTVATQTVEMSVSPIENLDFAQLNLNSGRASRDETEPQRMEAEPVVKTHPLASDLMREAGGEASGRTMKVTLIREDLAEKKARLFPGTAKETPERNKRVETPASSKGRSVKFSPLKVVIKRPKRKKAKSSNRQTVASEQQTGSGAKKSAQRPSAQSDPAQATAVQDQMPVCGIGGELQVNGIIPVTLNVLAREKTKTSINPKPTCDILNQSIPTDLSKPASISKPLPKTAQRSESPASAKKKVLSSATPRLDTIVEEHQACSYRKSTRNPSKSNVPSTISKMTEEEENFLNEIDQVYQQYDNNAPFNKTHEDFGLPVHRSLVKSIQTSIIPPETYLTSAKQSSNLTLNQINSTASDPLLLMNASPIQKTDLNSPFVQRDFTTPEKKLVPPPIPTTTRTTLSPERAMMTNYYTRIARLSAAEMYDLENGFTPEPSTSRVTDAVPISSERRRIRAQIKHPDSGRNAPEYAASQPPQVTSYTSDPIDWNECGAKIGAAWNKLHATVDQCAVPSISKQSCAKDFDDAANLEAMGVYDPFGFDSDGGMNDYDNVPAAVLPAATDDHKSNGEACDHTDGSQRKVRDEPEVLDDDPQQESVVVTPANDCFGASRPVTATGAAVKQLKKSLTVFRDMLFDKKNLVIDADVAATQDDQSVGFAGSNDCTDVFDDDDTVIENTPPSLLTHRNGSQVREPSVVASKLDLCGDDDSNISSRTQAAQPVTCDVPEDVQREINVNLRQIENASSVTSNNDTCLQDDTASVKLELSTPKLSALARAVVQHTAGLPKANIFVPKYYPPTYVDIENSLAEYNIPECRYQQPFYSDYADVTKKVDVGHNVLKIPSNTVLDLEAFPTTTGFIGLDAWRRQKYRDSHPSQDIGKINFHVAMAGGSDVILTPGIEPPTARTVMEWLKAKAASTETSPQKPQKHKIHVPLLASGNLDDSTSETMTLTPCTPDPLTPAAVLGASDTPKSSQSQREATGNLHRKALFSQSTAKPLNTSETSVHNNSHQITGASLENTHGFRLDCENLQQAKAISEPQNLTVMVVELHTSTRADLCPDPQHDPVRAIFYAISNDVPASRDALPREETGILAVDAGSDALLEGTGVHCQIVYATTELELMAAFVQLVRKWDPDICAGYEIEMHSWGYLVERCNAIGVNLAPQIARVNPAVVKPRAQEHGELQLAGRILLDVWRLMRHEVALQSYTFESLMYHVLHARVPKHSYRALAFWWDFRTNCHRHITAHYYLVRVRGVLQLLEQLDVLGRTAELAKLFGIQFFEVLSRGSQFRVESMMLRLAKPLNYVPVSPSVAQRARMRAPEFVPLIFEPESRFYTDPVIVLDFQSLYPSLIIAYNYCFSTCIGRVEHLGGNQPFEFGAGQLRLRRATVRQLEHQVNWSPCGVGFVRPSVRQGILPRMLQEILETRLMVKRSMQEHRHDKLLQRVLHSRQLGLKLIANVTYGYTAANFSGRMPCIEVGDSVVSKGRETLERAIRLIERTHQWRARVVYGDTDSLFVLVAGRSKAEAFRIGAEIAAAVTADNPAPVKLKLEKVLLPCVLQTKKRYVGYMYESAEQAAPEYLAKGIETVRRDGCPAVAKMLEKCLRTLFETRDVSLVKRYVCRQFGKLLSGRTSIQDLTFAREYRGAHGYRPGACVPALELARRWRRSDRRREPRAGERVPYVIVNGPPGLPLIRLVRCPRELLAEPSRLRPNAVYYISRVIVPALNRCFTLIGADMQAWFNEMPRRQLQVLPTDDRTSKKSTISQYFATMSCAGCGQQTRDGLCAACRSRPQATLVVLHDKLSSWERTYDEVNRICQSCCARPDNLECNSLDCPVMYRLEQVRRDLRQGPFVRGLLDTMDN